MIPKLVIRVLIAAGFVAMTACTDSADRVSAKSDPPAPETPVTGKTAFWEMYKLAHAWSPDVQVLSLKSEATSSAYLQDGKAPVWTAMFVSASKRQAHDFTYHALSDGTHKRGVVSGEARTWLGPVPQGQPFATAEMRIDSDAAFATASKDVEKWLKDNGDKEVHMVLGKESKYPAPVWSVYWGSEKKPLAAVVINASDGKVIKK